MDLNDFESLMNSARAIREFEKSPVSAEVIEKCLAIATSTASSSNMQPWEFIWVSDKNVKDELAEICLSQKAARSAETLIIVVARYDKWKQTQESILTKLNALPRAEFEEVDSALKYFKEIVPKIYAFKLFGMFKRFKDFYLGRTRPVMRGPYNNADLQLIAVKGASMAAQSLILALRSSGYDSCPMEGFDIKRLKKRFKLAENSTPIMVLAVGVRSRQKKLTPRIREEAGLQVTRY